MITRNRREPYSLALAGLRPATVNAVTADVAFDAWSTAAKYPCEGHACMVID
jgi:hypothetical protein